MLGLVDILDPRDKNPAADSVSKLTQWYTSHLEHVIRDAPDQYWWVHRRWKDAPRRQSARPQAA